MLKGFISEVIALTTIEKKKHPVAQACIVAHSHPEPTPKGGKALPQEGKLTNHLIINAEAHGGLPPAGTAHMATLTLCCQSEPADGFLRSEKQLSENIWIVLFKYLECPDTAAAIQSCKAETSSVGEENGGRKEGGLS
ncbi:hypothetical protein NQZ68_010894 [Dissostichus eleginoides]|nr:hypothetical protein NQZ68_010894 [Dissostichus eleginoides]